MSKFIDRTGEIHTNNQGYPMTIIRYRNSNDCDVQFEDGIIIENKSYACVKKGSVMRPINRIGEIHLANEGYYGTIYSHADCNNYILKFEDGNFSKPLRYADILKGEFKNHFIPSVHGVGYRGVGKYNSRDYKILCTKWSSMIKRCYSEKELLINPAYKTVEVCEEWKCLQNFGIWFEENWKDHMDNSWELDKDILSKGSKIYSPETCCFLPEDINKGYICTKSKRGKYPIGVTKVRKKFESQICIDGRHETFGYFDTPEEAFYAGKPHREQKLKNSANKYKGLIDDRAYEVLMTKEILITD